MCRRRPWTRLSLLGISGIANVLCCVKMAKYYELTEHDVVCTVLTDSAEMYRSRIAELEEQYGAYSDKDAAVDHALHLLGLRTDNMAELNYYDRKRVHNLKYYTWVEQQGKDMHDLNDLWYDEEKTWKGIHRQAADLDELINSLMRRRAYLRACKRRFLHEICPGRQVRQMRQGVCRRPDLTTCTCGGILDIQYDYAAIRRDFSPRDLARNEDRSMWRYRPFLPVEDTTVPPPLRVGWSPLYQADRLAKELGLKKLYVKDDGLNPTASLKEPGILHGGGQGQRSRGSHHRLLLHRQRRLFPGGQRRRRRIRDLYLRPQPGPQGQGGPAADFRATVISVDGSYEDTFELSKAAIDKWGWYNRNAAINPYLSEGKKTVTLEIMEQLHWQVPDFIALSVGDGCTIAGAWKGLKDLYAAVLLTGCPDSSPSRRRAAAP